MDACISFPKSGRTWLRVMLDGCDVPLGWTHAGAGHGRALPIGKLTTKEAKKYDRMLFLHRDPRDTVVSGFHQKMLRRGGYQGTISDFIRDPRHGIEKIVRYNAMWLAFASAQPKMIVETYEGLTANTVGTISRIVKFFGHVVNEQLIQEIVDFNQFHKMQEREREGRYANTYGKILSPRDPSLPNSFKVRKGKVAGYLEELSDVDIDYCNSVIDNLSKAA